MGRYTLIICSLLLFVSPALSEIHRARSMQTYKHRFRNLDTDGKSDTAEWTKWLDEKVFGHSRRVWIYSCLSAGLVGMTGLFPLLVIPMDAGAGLKSKESRSKLQMLLSFAVGSLLGDVFLHLLPEAWIHVEGYSSPLSGFRFIGGWALAGLLSFYFIEKLFSKDEDEDEKNEREDEGTEREEVNGEGDEEATNTADTTVETSSNASDDSSECEVGRRFERSVRNERAGNKNCDDKKTRRRRKGKRKIGDVSEALAESNEGSLMSHDKILASLLSSLPSPSVAPVPAVDKKKQSIKVSGWLNLLANVVDNFTHGLAVAGSYCISPKMGVLTTLAILLHEIPHEVGDFAILLRAGFDRWKAARVQLLTAMGGIVGTLLALSAESAKILGDSTAWILPFTAGGFLNIALIAIVPDLLKETNAKNSLKQLCLVCSGILVMGLVTALAD